MCLALTDDQGAFANFTGADRFYQKKSKKSKVVDNR